MSDKLDDIIDSLRKSESPKPTDSAKNAAISKAMTEFDKKYSKNHQGNTSSSRLMDTVKTVYENICKTIKGEYSMKKAYMAAGGVCVAVVAVTLMNSTYLTSDLLFGDKYKKELAIEEKSVGSTFGMFGAKSERKDYDSGNNLVTGGGAIPLSAANNVDKQATELQADIAPPPSAPSSVAPMKKAKRDGRAFEAEESFYRKESRSLGGMAVADAVAPSSVMVQSPRSASKVSPYNEVDDVQGYSYQDKGRDKFEEIKENPVKVTKEEPVSTFSIDVDTSSYSFMRASLNNNVLPQKNSVRVEELVNYFPYNYEVPESKSVPFKANMSVFPTPWNNDTKLLHIGIKGYQIENKEKPRSNLVFLIDTSGSMHNQNKLPLLKNSMKLLLDGLRDDDTVSIVTYAGSAGVALEPTKVSDKSKIIRILDSLGAGGSTAGAQGIKTAYRLAKDNFDKNGVNRVILATDGDFNVGITNQEELKGYIERQRDSGIFLSVLGFGMGNYNDAIMQTLAQNGNGNAAYIDSLSEARKVLVEEASSTLFPIAKDVKIQIEFNPTKVVEYRLIGYETRMLKREDFNNDKVDAGDIGAGHSVTAIYEMIPVGSKARLIDDSRYQKVDKKEKDSAKDSDNSDEYAFVKIRYKLPDSNKSKLITTPVDNKVEKDRIADASANSRFATAVAAFAQILRGDSYTKSYSYDDVIDLAKSAKGDDEFGYRAEFINLVRLAKSASR
ncbi:MAG: VWA domain-containing protein [Rickettsiales bacterium]